MALVSWVLSLIHLPVLRAQMRCMLSGERDAGQCFVGGPPPGAATSAAGRVLEWADPLSWACRCRVQVYGDAWGQVPIRPMLSSWLRGRADGAKDISRIARKGRKGGRPWVSPTLGWD